jgi:hypothetical protein
MCMDYRALNKLTVKISALFRELMKSLTGSRVHSISHPWTYEVDITRFE